MNPRKGFRHTGVLNCHWIPPERGGEGRWKEDSHITQFSVKLTVLKHGKHWENKAWLTAWAQRRSLHSIQASRFRQAVLYLQRSAHIPSSDFQLNRDTQKVISTGWKAIYLTSLIVLLKQNQYIRSPSLLIQRQLLSYKPTTFPATRPANGSQPYNFTADPAQHPDGHQAETVLPRNCPASNPRQTSIISANTP